MPDDPGPPRSTTRATPTLDIRNIVVDPRSLRDAPLGDPGSAGLVAAPGAVAGSAGVAQATAHHTHTGSITSHEAGGNDSMAGNHGAQEHEPDPERQQEPAVGNGGSVADPPTTPSMATPVQGAPRDDLRRPG